MDISFKRKKLEKIFNSEAKLNQAYGLQRVKKIKRLMTELHAAETLGEFYPPNSKPHRCHELKGDAKGTFSFDLDHPHRLIVEPNHETIPRKNDGSIDWHAITAITILEVRDTHG